MAQVLLEEAKDMEEVERDMDNTLSKLEKPLDKKGIYTIEDYAIAFVYGMGYTQRNRFKKMLEQGIKCGECVALNYGVNYDDLIKEVSRILKVEVKHNA